MLAEDRRDHVPVRVVGLNPAPEDVAFFATALGSNAPIIYAPTLDQAAPRQATPFPWALAALAVVAAVALGLREGWAPKLDWRAVVSALRVDGGRGVGDARRARRAARGGPARLARRDRAR